MIRVSVANENHVYRRHHISGNFGGAKISRDNEKKERGELIIYISRASALARAARVLSIYYYLGFLAKEVKMPPAFSPTIY